MLTANTQPAWPRADEPAAGRGQAGCRGPPPHPVFSLRVRSRRRSYTLSSTRAASSPGAWRHTSENPRPEMTGRARTGPTSFAHYGGARGRKARKGFPPTCPGSWAAWWLTSYCEEQRGPSRLSSRPSVCFCGCDGRVAGGGGSGKKRGCAAAESGAGGCGEQPPVCPLPEQDRQVHAGGFECHLQLLRRCKVFLGTETLPVTPAGTRGFIGCTEHPGKSL